MLVIQVVVERSSCTDISITGSLLKISVMYILLVLEIQRGIAFFGLPIPVLENSLSQVAPNSEKRESFRTVSLFSWWNLWHIKASFWLYWQVFVRSNLKWWCCIWWKDLLTWSRFHTTIANWIPHGQRTTLADYCMRTSTSFLSASKHTR